MSEIAIKVENLSKRYNIGVAEARPRTFAEAATRFLGRPLQNFRRLRRLSRSGSDGEDVIWALRDVSFEVRSGEVIGVIGRNGAGKSTLLKVLSRITHPTGGRVTLDGRVASLLEVGTGFHSELTGRENVYLNGTILGMSRREIDRKFDEIVDFSGVEKFIDTPVKRYSSGMGVRLAFSVAAHLEPEILLVDEVLAVGDAEFQKKSLGKMGEVAKQGRTILFVSHNMGAVNSLCETTLLLTRGEVQKIGKTSEVVAAYLSSGRGADCAKTWDRFEEAPGSPAAKIHSVRVLSNGISSNLVEIDEAVEVEIKYWGLKKGLRLLAVLKILDPYGNVAFEAYDTPEANLHPGESGQQSYEQGLYRSTCRIPPNFLNDQQYFVSVAIVSTPPPRIEISLDEILSFSVADTGVLRAPGFFGRWLGAVRTQFHWRVERLGDLPDGSDRLAVKG